ncbi:MAG: Ldh family oxidoreductase [Granulosicoccus sp.]
MSLRYDAESLLNFAKTLCLQSGMSDKCAHDVATVLTEGDLLGHDTHGLMLLKPYLDAVKHGDMLGDGNLKELSVRPAVASWDGNFLPGPHLTLRAIETATSMAKKYGTGHVVIRRSSHIGALAAYLEEPARQGFLVQLVCSDPSVANVAPFGGTEPLFTPNPMAWGIPTSRDPIMIDISASTTTVGMSARLHQAEKSGEHDWWLDSEGKPCNSPSVIFQNPPGSLLPLGGLDAGHKGYGLALFIESLTSGLSGYGRADGVDIWGANVSVQITDIEAFGEKQAFLKQMDHLVEQSINNKPSNPENPVRLPGQRGLARKREQLDKGVLLHEAIMPSLNELIAKSGIDGPVVIG